MGVPKFYRWISERYPCLSEVVKDYQIPEFDNLYLDMNGIIHVCSHPEDDNPHFRITEEKIFQDIFHYIEVLFRLIKPRKVFFMAVDGVAPRAKMNQQRGRRFRSAREAENLVKKAIEKGEVLPTEARFDSNCITPGTEFMAKLQEQLQYFVVKKISTDRLWQGVRVYLSGHETPGEGEHKVMDFIRHEKSRPDFDPNTRHCLYGLDADLMMLGLTSHEPHFSLLREEVRFGKQAQKRSTTAEETTFHLLHLSLMREYIDFEFSDLKEKLPFGYDLERIIDDWVLMGFLVGNDFIPHLPDLHIHHNALPMLWKTYKRVLPGFSGYLNEGGVLNLPNFEKFMRVLSKYDVDNFSEKYADIQWLDSRKSDKNTLHALSSDDTGIPTANEFMTLKEEDSGDETFSASLQSDMAAMTIEYDFSEEERDDDIYDEQIEPTEQFFEEFRKFKAKYYKEKLQYTKVNEEVLREQAYEYVKAIQWILHYYFNGVPSWSWFYPYHYAPYLSDVRNFSHVKLEYDRASPFFPFQQLMAVLPAASKNLIPQPLQTLMISDISPVKDFYPVDFETDLNGKQQEWEAVVLIPFIDEKRLISAMKPLEAKMTDEEKGRNKHGPHILFEFSPHPQGTFTSCVFPDLVNHHAIVSEVPKDKFWLRPSELKKGLCPGVRLDVYFPGFPTLKHLPHSAKLKKSGVKVFQHVSKGDNMILTITNNQQYDHEKLAREIIGQSIYVGWPHLMEARVNALADGETKFYGVDSSTGHKSKSKSHSIQLEVEDMDQDAATVFKMDVRGIRDTYMFRKGIETGDTTLLVYASPLVGQKYICGNHGKVTLEKQWSSSSLPFVHQATVKDIAVNDPSYKQYTTIEELFSPKAEVFMLGQPHYGVMGEVLSVEPKNDGRIRVDFAIQEEPDFGRIFHLRQKMSTQYIPGYIMARQLGINTFILSRITGSVYITQGSKKEEESNKPNRTNVGLNLKFNKTNMEVPGFTKKTEEWLYSYSLKDVITQYLREFPEIFECLANSNNESSYYESDVFEGQDRTLQHVSKFLKTLPCASVQPVPHGSDILEERIVAEIEGEVRKVKEINRKKKKHIKMQVRPHLLYRPLAAQLTLVPDPLTTYSLFDRIVNVRDGFSVPLGLRGTVVGITNAEKEQDILYDVVFDEEFLGGLTIRCSPCCGYRMPKMAMINLTHGERKAQGKVITPTKPTAVVKPQAATQGKTYSEMAQHKGYQDSPRFQGPKQQFHNQSQRYQQGQGFQGHGGRSQDGYHGNRQPGWQQQQQHGNQPQAFQAQGGREFHDRAHRGNQYEMSNQNEFADMWNQLQGAYGPVDSNPMGNMQQPKANPNRGQYAHRDKHKPSHHQGNIQGPSLQDAAMALQGSQFNQGMQPDGQKGQNKSKKNAEKNKNQPPDQSGMQKIDIKALFNKPMEFVPSKKSGSSKKKDKKPTPHQEPTNKISDPFSSPDEFAAIFNALQVTHQSETQSMSSKKDENSLGESTAALCQMLHINPGDSGPSGSKVKAAQQETKASKPQGPSQEYGKQLSVEQLFTEVKEVQNQNAAPVEQGSVHGQQKGHGKGGKNMKTAVEALTEWCQTAGLSEPTFDNQTLRDGNHRVTVKLSNGATFHGSCTRNLNQATESAAGVALLHLGSGPHASRGPPGPQQHQYGPQQHGPPQHGPQHRGPQHGPQQHGPKHGQQHGPQSGPQHGPPRLSASPNSAFTPVRQQMGMPMGPRPPFPVWGQGPPFPPPPHFGPPPHQQRFPPQQNNQARGPGYWPQGPFPKSQGQAPFQGQSPEKSFHSSPRAPRDRGPKPTQQDHWGGGNQGPHGRGHQGVKANKDPGQQSSKTDPETPKKANPFIPLQVMRQKKTPQKETRKEDSEVRQDEESATCDQVQDTSHVPSTASADCIPTATTCENSSAEKPQTIIEGSVLNVSSGDNTAEAVPPSKRDTASKKSNQTPPRRPKSRIAAKFDGLK